MRRMRKTKIVATLGPASSDYDTIRALFEAGADVFRLNMSHGSHEEIGARHRIIRQIEEDPRRFLQGQIARCQHIGRIQAGDRMLECRLQASQTLLERSMLWTQRID